MTLNPSTRLPLKSLLIGVLFAIAGTAYAQVPSTNDTSDANGNTGMGTAALNPGTTGAQNTAAGIAALTRNTTGSNNTAAGGYALNANTTGVDNTAIGGGALFNNTSGGLNTASGVEALLSNTTGKYNTASGDAALAMNNADGNSAFGAFALGDNTSGTSNSALGINSLRLNTTGNANTASGVGALNANTTGSQSTAIGVVALAHSNGDNNTAVGAYTLNANTGGYENTASGVSALFNNTTGSGNIALGVNAGFNLTTGNDNIDVGNRGVAGESGTIRIGDPTRQTATYIAGIWGRRAPRGAAVVVNSSGQLGVEESSERYKSDIAPMGPSSAKIAQLRPVTYRLKTDPAGDLQYGLIAEEVNQVYPELVVRDDAGQIEGVRYDRLAPILLNEVQQKQHELATQAAQLGELKQQLAELRDLNRAMQAALTELQDKGLRVAKR